MAPELHTYQLLPGRIVGLLAPADQTEASKAHPDTDGTSNRDPPVRRTKHNGLFAVQTIYAITTRESREEHKFERCAATSPIT